MDWRVWMSRKTPAVTSVEEWTSAETGVGAAIARGSQLEKGNWALFVMAASNSPRKQRLQLVVVRYQSPRVEVSAIVNNSPMSPRRFVRATTKPALWAWGAW